MYFDMFLLCVFLHFVSRLEINIDDTVLLLEVLGIAGVRASSQIFHMQSIVPTVVSSDH